MSTHTANEALAPALDERLSAFVNEVNAHPGMSGLLKGWEPLLVIETLDDGERFHLRVEDCRARMVPGIGPEPGHAILIRGERAVLDQVFTGAINPAHAYLEGTLEVFGDDRDHVKLDALCLVLWGM